MVRFRVVVAGEAALNEYDSYQPMKVGDSIDVAGSPFIVLEISHDPVGADSPEMLIRVARK